jgi:hypothetical protein
MSEHPEPGSERPDGEGGLILVRNLKLSEYWIPPRCRKKQYRERTIQMELHLRGTTAELAPIALITHSDWNDVTIQYRWYNCQLWWRSSKHNRTGGGRDAIEEYMMPKDVLPSRKLWNDADGGEPEVRKTQRRDVNEYLLVDGQVWQKIDEPVWVISTYGLSHTHGGTGMSLSSYGRERFFFRVDQTEAAIQEYNYTARRHGYSGTERLLPDSQVQVLIPEAIRAKAGRTTVEALAAKEATRTKLRAYHTRAKAAAMVGHASPTIHRPLRALKV